MEKDIFILIDGNAILHRSYHATPRFMVDGKLVNSVYGFISTLFSTIDKFKPKYIAVAFDVKGPTFRDEIFKHYKAKRIKPPQEFYDQIPDVWDFVRVMEIPLLCKEGFEADDVIGTIAKKVNGDLKSGEVIIVTGDQDTLQLVDERIKVAMPAMGRIKETIYDATAVFGKLGLKPTQVIDYKALSGDSSDNIPGVRGIGNKTALALLREYSSLDKIYKQIKDDQSRFLEKFSQGTLKKLLLGEKDALMSRELATIKTDVELDFRLSQATTHDYDEKNVTQFLNKLNFRSLIKRMPTSHRKAGNQGSLF